MANSDPDSAIRLEAFHDVCRRRGWQGEGGRWKSSEVASAIGKAVSLTSDLLNGRKTLGPKLARDIEEALRLPRGSLDGTSEWPFPGIDPSEFSDLTRDQLLEIQGSVRGMLIAFRSAPEQRGNGTDRH